MTWWNSDWAYRKSIVIQNGKVADNHSNFPILVSEVDNDLKIHVAQANAEDIVFVDTDDSTKLDHEIEKWDSSDGTLVAHIRIPTMDKDSNKTIYVYYGNAGSADQQNVTGVWDGDFLSVLHLKEVGDGTSDEYKDSTSNSYDGTGGSGRVPTQVNGKIGKGQSFPRISNDDGLYIGFTDANSIKPVVNRMYELFFYPTADSESTILGGDNSGDGNILRIQTGNIAVWNAGTWTIILNGVTATGVTDNSGLSVNLNQWNRLIAYQTITTTWENFYIGQSKTNRYFGGIIDEFRISNIIRSADWITTSFNTQDDPSSFYTLGSEEIPSYLLQEDGDSILLETGDKIILDTAITSYNKTFTVDAILKKDDIDKTFTADAILVPGVTEVDKEFTVDSFLRKVAEKEFTVSAVLIQEDIELEFTVDAFLRKSQETLFTTDVILKKSDNDKTFTVDAYLRKPFEELFTTDALLKKSDNDLEFTIDAIIESEVIEYDKTFTVDSLVGVVGIKPTILKLIEIKPDSISAPEIYPTNVKSINIKPKAVKSVNIKPVGVETIDIKPTLISSEEGT